MVVERGGARWKGVGEVQRSGVGEMIMGWGETMDETDEEGEGVEMERIGERRWSAWSGVGEVGYKWKELGSGGLTRMSLYKDLPLHCHCLCCVRRGQCAVKSHGGD